MKIQTVATPILSLTLASRLTEGHTIQPGQPKLGQVGGGQVKINDEINFNGHKSVKEVADFYEVSMQDALRMANEGSFCGFDDNAHRIKNNGVSWSWVNQNDHNNKRVNKKLVTFQVEVDPNLTGDYDKVNGGLKMFPPRLQCRAIIMALETWQKYADVQFIELERKDGIKTCSQYISPECYQRYTKPKKTKDERPMMNIGFGSGYHQVVEPCGYPFDSEWGTLAHAYGPGTWGIEGDTHFDKMERWTYRTGKHGSSLSSGPDLYIVAFHEFGHALGLPHNSYTDSIMYPTYAWKEWTKKWTVNSYDVSLIQSMYGPQSKKIRSCFAPAKRSRKMQMWMTKRLGRKGSRKWEENWPLMSPREYADIVG